MNCSGKVTHFVTLVERYLPPASRNPAPTDGELHGRAFGRAISGGTANKTLLASTRPLVTNRLHSALEAGSAPFAVHPPLGRPGGLDIQGLKAGVADHPNVGLAAFRCHPFQGFARHLQQGGAEEPGNPVVLPGALQLGRQEILQGTAA